MDSREARDYLPDHRTRGTIRLRGGVMRRVIAMSAVGVATVTALALVSGTGGAGASSGMLNGPSSIVGVRYYLAHPDAAPASLRAQFESANRALASGRTSASAAEAGSARTVMHVFNRDTEGLPQNEEAVSACTRNSRRVISGTNDYRGIV